MKKLKLERLAHSGDELCNLAISGAYYRIYVTSVSLVCFFFFLIFILFTFQFFAGRIPKNSGWRISSGASTMV